jgi:hypothetical protein
MELPITHPAFRTQKLAVETAGFFRGARLLVNGDPAQRIKGKYTVKSDGGTEVSVELKANFLDAVPKAKIGDDLVELARALTWYEYFWLGIPILLVFIGGGLGALVGIFAVYSSARVFRADLNAFAKYAFTGLISIGAFVVFAVLAIVLQILIGQPQQ